MADVRHFDIAVLGGGSGLTAAYWAERDGKEVAVIDKRPHALGGTCVNRGCIPTKQLIQTAEVLKTIRDAERFGVTLDQDSVKVDFKRIMDKMRARRKAAAGGTKEWIDGAFTPFYGEARFAGDKIIEMEDGTRLTGDQIFIALGARPLIPPIEGLDQIDHWTNREVLELEEQPESLLILGGGYIGAEFAHFFSTLGTRVTVVESQSCLLREDADVRSLFTQEFRKKVDLRNNTRAVKAVKENGRSGLLIQDKTSGKQETVFADKILIATGRAPNTDGLGLDQTGVKTDEKGFIIVDDHLRTDHPDIYAYGDIIGQEMFKHTSSYEGELAYRNSQGSDLQVDYSANPHAIFSDPQIGSVGLTEEACKDKGLDYKAVKKVYDEAAKGEIIGHPPGFAKLLVENGTDRILGFHMIGPHAADLIHEVVVAMNAPGAKASFITKTIHVHPTMPELVRSVFDEAAGR